MRLTTSLMVTGLALSLAGCTATVASYRYNNVDPIPGSIIYNGQPRTKLTKSPIGSTFTHNFRTSNGDKIIETYQIQPDRSLRIIDRRVVRDWMLFGRDD